MPDSDPVRLKAKPDVRRLLLSCARKDKHIYYGELVKKVPKLRMKGPSPPLYRLLDIIDVEEAEVHEGPMISAMAVHKKPHSPASERPRVEPGDGFYETAYTLYPNRLTAVTDRDLTVADRDRRYAFWEDERKAVVAYARNQPR